MDIREQLRGALPGAIKARDAVAVAALRSALAAIENAEAVDASVAPEGEGERQRAGGRGSEGEGDIAGSVLGVGAADVERHTLTQVQMEAIVRTEVSDREAAERDYLRAGQRDYAERLRSEADVLLSYLGGT